MPNYDYHCSSCNGRYTDFSSYQDRDQTRKCEHCGETAAHRVPGMPKVLTASYPDGYKRPGWEDVKATARLQEAKANINHRSTEALDIQKEIIEREKKTKTTEP